ncbi:hypothetical protein [Empedobacter sp. UBA5637]|uniref:hypothetical protein n=1 Tax=Empedobacter sp. UBA5637 TaxID=1946442 RepID=UPI0025C0E039|nr:hypothetical protein [Empedobacter sp. UBA5637]
MRYILINEQLAIELGIIEEKHYYRTGEKKVIFKEDILTVWKDYKNGIIEDNQFEYIDTKKALKLIEKWTQ